LKGQSEKLDMAFWTSCIIRGLDKIQILNLSGGSYDFLPKFENSLLLVPITGEQRTSFRFFLNWQAALDFFERIIYSARSADREHFYYSSKRRYAAVTHL